MKLQKIKKMLCTKCGSDHSLYLCTILVQDNAYEDYICVDCCNEILVNQIKMEAINEV